MCHNFEVFNPCTVGMNLCDFVVLFSMNLLKLDVYGGT